MNSKISTFFIAGFISMVFAQGPPPGGHPHGGPPCGPPGGPHDGPPGGPHDRPHGPPPCSFPECEEYEKQLNEWLEEKRGKGEIGPEKCESGDHKMCQYQDKLKARNATEAEPSKNCWEQVKALYEPKSDSAAKAGSP